MLVNVVARLCEAFFSLQFDIAVSAAATGLHCSSKNKVPAVSINMSPSLLEASK